MDPITFLRLGQIRQQELLDEARRYRRGSNWIAESGIATLWQRLRARLSAAPAADPAPKPARRSPYPNLPATSR